MISPDTLAAMAGMVLVSALFMIVLAAACASAARRQIAQCRALEPDATPRAGILLFAAGLVTFFAGAAVLLGLTGITDLDSAPLASFLSVQALATLLGAGVVVLGARAQPGGPWVSLGLVRHSGRSPLSLAVCAWLAAFPALWFITMANQQVMGWIGLDSDPQDVVRIFSQDPSARTDPMVWLTVAAVIPLGEEVLFRGALQGGLRRLMPAWGAMALSAFVFSLSHEVSAILPVAALGLLLAWLYERTGSLVVPIAVHCLHNGMQLLLMALLPESAPP